MAFISSAFLTLVFLSFHVLHLSCSQIVTINTTAGIVTGTATTGKLNNFSYTSFINIPYAMPPINNLRFKAPVTFSTIKEGIINTNTADVICPQLMGNSVIQTEDCLILNVYIPQTATSNSSLPVMVWIHGGSFNAGWSTIYQPEFLVAQDIIVVTVNYRLGALGFLSLGDSNIPGNAGLKDQTLALKWVKNEIKQFGGDPDMVTVFGESAGAVSVHHHILSSYSSNLFQQAILQSGSATTGFGYLESGFEDQAKLFAQRLGCVTNNQVVFTCLQNASVSSIIYNQELPVDIEAEFLEGGLTFIPSKETVKEGAFHSDTLANLMINVANPVRTIVGTNKDEGLIGIRQSNVYFNNFFSNLKYFIPENVRTKLNDSEISNRTNQLKAHYFPDNRAPSIYNYQGYTDLFTDSFFALPAITAAQSLLTSGSSAVYMYQFNYNGDFKLTVSDAYMLKVSGVAHGDDLAYLFYTRLANQNTQSDAYNVLKIMVKLWTTFATTGKPIPDIMGETSVLFNVTWDQITTSSTNYLSITATPAMVFSTFKDTSVVQLWDLMSSLQSGSLCQESTMILIIVSFLITTFFSGS